MEAATVAGGYFGRALVVDLADASAETLPLPDDVLRALHRRRRPRAPGSCTSSRRRASTRSAPEAPLAFCFSPLVGTPLTTSAKFAVVAKSPLTGLLNDALASSHFAIAGKLTGHDAIVVRGACEEPSVLLVDGDGPRLEPAGDLWGLSADEAEQRLRERLGKAWRVASIGPAGRAPGQVRDDLARRPPRRPRRPRRRARREAAQGGRRAARRRRSPPPTRRPSSPPRATCARARSARRPRSTASSARSRTCSPSTRSRRCRRATSRPSTFADAPRLAAEDLAEARSVARDSCASCSIGCEHIYKGAGRQAGARRVRERLRARPAVRRLRPRRRPRGERPLRRARARHDLDRRDDRLGDGVRRARPDRRAVAALRRRRRDAARDRGDRRARGPRRAAGARARAPPPRSSARARRAFAPHVKGLELPGYEPRTLQAMALGLAVNARGADHNRSGAYEADLSGAPRPPARRLAPTSPPRSRPRTAPRSWTR